MKNIPPFTLYNGIKIPAIGFGTWQIPNGEIAYNSALYALKNGYKHIDTARAYGNEESVGKAVRDSGISREEIFITTKLPAEVKSYKGALESYRKTMEKIGLDYIDLYLIHAPWPWTEIGADYTKQNIEVWKAMEEILDKGHCRAIGVSNFNVADLTAILENGTIKPVANQIKYYIGYTQEEITRFCQNNDILVEGYSPLATGAILNNSLIADMAKRYNTSLPKICIRYVIQNGVLPLPKSIHPEYIIQNADIGFEISDEDMKYLDSLTDTTKK